MSNTEEKTTWIEKNARHARVLLLVAIAVWVLLALLAWILWP